MSAGYRTNSLPLCHIGLIFLCCLTLDPKKLKKFSLVIPMDSLFVILNALAVFPAAYFGLVLATYFQQWPSHTIVLTLLHASPLFISPLIFAFLTWASLRSRARWFQMVIAVLMLPAIPFGTIYGAISLRVNWGK